MSLLTRCLWFGAIALVVVLAFSCKITCDDMTIRARIDLVPGLTGSGPVTTQDRTPGDVFQAIDAGGAFDVRIIEDNAKASVTVEAQDNILPTIETRVVDGILCISAVKSFTTERPVKVTVHQHGLRRIELSGATTCTATGLTGDLLEIEVDGSSTATLAGTVRDLRVATSGASLVEASMMTAERITAEAEGSSRIALAGPCQEARLTASGACAISAGKLDAAKTILSAEGASTIHVGRAGQVSQESSGASTITIGGSLP